ncbi:MAG: 16S rRNA (uracil(1498)-N(3))-methyltransferase [Mariprofundaceae bacterium]
MPISRLYLPTPLEIGIQCELEAEQAHYLRSVMRLNCGDSLVIFNGNGGEYHSEITSLHKGQASCQLLRFDAVDRELGCRVRLVQACNRSEKIETVLQKGTELGASSFDIVHSERSTFKLSGKKLELRLVRWQKIIIEAAEQSGRTRLPILRWVPSLKQLEDKAHSYVLHPASDQSWEKRSQELKGGSNIRLAIGPEGGWSRSDLTVLNAKGFQPLAFGSRIMRTETAGPALLAAIQSLHMG